MANAFRFEGRTYRVDRMMLSEARAIQKATGLSILQFEDAISVLDAEALTALIWIARKREDPALRFSDVDGDLSTFEPLADEDDGDGEEVTGGEGKDQPAGSTAGPPEEAASRRSRRRTPPESGSSSASDS